MVLVNLVFVLSARLLFLYSFKGLFNTYFIYFAYIKSVAINKDLSQPLSWSKRQVKPDMTEATLLLEKFSAC